MDADGGEHAGGFRLSNIIDLVFPSWRDVVIYPPDGSMGKAMRYYRMWIYVSVGAVAFPALIFAAVVAWIFSADYFQLLPVPVYDWTFIYMYFAIFLQIVPCPIIGCFGARRLNECLLWTYWGSMVALCLGDAAIGVVWAMKFSRLNNLLFEHLYSRLNNQYGIEADFTRLWDQFQTTERCCGIDNATDYFNTAWYRQLSDQPKGMFLSTDRTLLPNSCCGITGDLSIFNCSWNSGNFMFASQGCYLPLHDWMHKMGDILFVLGYSVIAFVRAALAFCLYSEIKHFIRKIYIRGVPRQLNHASLSTGSDLVNFHRTQNSTKRNNSSSLIPPSRPRDRSMRRWSFMRGFRGFRTNLHTRAGNSTHTQLTELQPTQPPPIIPELNSTTVKLKSINEENTTML